MQSVNYVGEKDEELHQFYCSSKYQHQSGLVRN